MNVPRFAAFARVRLSFNDKETLILLFIYCKNTSLVDREALSICFISLPLARFDCNLFVWIKLRGFFHFDYTPLARLCFRDAVRKPHKIQRSKDWLHALRHLRLCVCLICGRFYDSVLDKWRDGVKSWGLETQQISEEFILKYNPTTPWEGNSVAIFKSGVIFMWPFMIAI